MSEMDRYYEILGLKPGASEEEIIQAYKTLIRAFQADRCGTEESAIKVAETKIKQIDEAFKTLLVSRNKAGEETTLPATNDQTSVTRKLILPSGERTTTVVRVGGEPTSTHEASDAIKEIRADLQLQGPTVKVTSPSDLVSGHTSSAIGVVKEEPTGVGGWLKLLVFGLMLIGPFVGAAHLVMGFGEVDRLYPGLQSLPQWETYQTVQWCLFLIFASIGFYGGWGLRRRRDWSAVSRAKAILWIVGPVGTMVMSVIVPATMFGQMNRAVIPEFIKAFGASMIAAVIWTAYLSKSKRVRNTYGGPKSTPGS